MEVIFSNYNHNTLRGMAQAMKLLFVNLYDKVIVNENQIKKIKNLCANRKGPVIFMPTHRSYIDFLMMSAVLFFYNLEVPHIVAGEDFLGIAGVVHLLRMSGAFFMKRSFRDDPLYKALFNEYVTQLAVDNINMEFFIEGTRSRTNKMLSPKFGILGIITNAFFDKKIEEATFVPVTMNYTRTFEDESFPNELRGAPKVKETLDRIVKAANVLSLNFGTIYLDFFDPISMTQTVANIAKTSADFDPFSKKADRTKFNNYLGNELTFTLQSGIRIMPPTLVSTIMLLYRKGISEENLQ